MLFRIRSRIALWILVPLLASACGGQPREVVDITGRLGADVYQQGLVRPRVDLDRVGVGWHQPEKARRWTSAVDAELQVSIRDTSAGRALLWVKSPGSSAREISVMVNDMVLGTSATVRGRAVIEMAIPEGALRHGMNRITLSCDRVERIGGRALGVSVDEVQIQPGVEFGAPQERVEARTGRFSLGSDHWIEDLTGILGAGPLEVDWASTATDLADTLELLRYEGADLVLVSSSALSGISGTAQLAPDEDQVGTHVLRTRNGAGLQLVAVRQNRVAHPDIVLVVVDTWRGDHVGIVSPELVETPNLDALAKEGVWYSSAFAHIPITGPSHASLFTGRLPSEAGVVNNHVHRLDRRLPTVADRLRARGYVTNGIVSLDPIHIRFGFGRGFERYKSDLGPGGLLSADEVLDQGLQGLLPRPAELPPRFDFVHFCDPHGPYDAHGLVDHRARLRLNGELLKEVSTSDYSPQDLWVELRAGPNELVIESDHPYRILRLRVVGTGKTGAVINEPVKGEAYDGTARFTLDAEHAGEERLYVCLDDEDGDVEEVRARYVREVEAVDAAIGEVLAAVRARGRWDQSLIIVTSDHGEGLGYGDGGLGHVHNLYDRLVHVPLIIKPPAAWGWKPGQRRDDVVALSDLPVAVLSALRIPPLEDATGRDVFRKPRGRDDAILLETHRPQAWKTRFALRDATTKLIWTPVDDAWEFYDLSEDPDEQQNLFDATNPEIARRQEKLDSRVKGLLGGAN
jgi:arylsulfatase A-like enzyme